MRQYRFLETEICPFVNFAVYPRECEHPASLEQLSTTAGPILCEPLICSDENGIREWSPPRDCPFRREGPMTVGIDWSEAWFRTEDRLETEEDVMPEEKTPLKRIVKFDPAYENEDTGGRASVYMRLVVAGPLGAVELEVSTGWMLKWKKGDGAFHRPCPSILRYHSPNPLHKDDPGYMTESCEYLDGKTCYSDGPSGYADEIFHVLVEKGSDALWERLELEYTRQFEIPF